MSPNTPRGPRVPDEASLRDTVTNGPIPEFEPEPTVSTDSIGDVSPGDVFSHGSDHLIVTDIDPGDRPAGATLHLFNQRTTETIESNLGDIADLVTSTSPTHHFSEVVIPADASYHVERSQRGRNLPHPNPDLTL